MFSVKIIGIVLSLCTSGIKSRVATNVNASSLNYQGPGSLQLRSCRYHYGQTCPSRPETVPDSKKVSHCAIIQGVAHTSVSKLLTDCLNILRVFLVQ